MSAFNPHFSTFTPGGRVISLIKLATDVWVMWSSGQFNNMIEYGARLRTQIACLISNAINTTAASLRPKLTFPLPQWYGWLIPLSRWVQECVVGRLTCYRRLLPRHSATPSTPGPRPSEAGSCSSNLTKFCSYTFEHIAQVTVVLHESHKRVTRVSVQKRQQVLISVWEWQFDLSDNIWRD